MIVWFLGLNIPILKFSSLRGIYTGFHRPHMTATSYLFPMRLAASSTGLGPFPWYQYLRTAKNCLSLLYTLIFWRRPSAMLPSRLLLSRPSTARTQQSTLKTGRSMDRYKTEMRSTTMFSTIWLQYPLDLLVPRWVHLPVVDEEDGYVNIGEIG